METLKELSSLPLPSLNELKTVLPNAIEGARRGLNKMLTEEGMRAALEEMNCFLPRHLSCLKEAEEKMLKDGEGHHFLSSVNRNFAMLTGLRTYLIEIVELCSSKPLPEDLAEESVEVIALIELAERNVAYQMAAALERAKSVIATLASDWEMRWSPSRGFYLDRPFSFTL